MHPQPTLIEPANRPFLKGQRVFSNKLDGVFEVIGYTNKTPDSMVFIRDNNSNFPLTYDVAESSLSPV